nr:hypothetical protein [Phytohabitans flavus]
MPPRPRIDDHQAKIDKCVQYQICQRHDDHRALHDRQVLALYGGADGLADARQGEEVLQDDGAADQVAEDEPGEGEQRQRRRPQGVAQHDVRVRHAAGPRREHVVFAQHRDEVGAQHPQEERRGAEHEHDHGKAGVVEAPEEVFRDRHPAERRKYLELVRQELGQHDAPDERRDRLEPGRDAGDDPVQPAVGAGRADKGQRHRDEQREHQREYGDLERHRKAVGERLGHRLLCLDRVAEVAADRVLEPVPVPDPERVVEAVLRVELRDGLGRGELTEDQHGRGAGDETCQAGGPGGDEDEDDDRVDELLADEARGVHVASSRCASGCGGIRRSTRPAAPVMNSVGAHGDTTSPAIVGPRIASAFRLSGTPSIHV